MGGAGAQGAGRNRVFSGCICLCREFVYVRELLSNVAPFGQRMKFGNRHS